MKNIKFNNYASLIAEDQLMDLLKKLIIENSEIKKAIGEGYENDRASVCLPDDYNMLNNVKNIIYEKKKLNPSYLVVVGIGGSNLGTIAVQEAILGKTYNQKTSGLKVMYADTVDPDMMKAVISIIEPVLQRGENVIINGVSKSGGTTETIANFEVLIELLKKYVENYQQFVVVTTDKNSKFWNLSIEHGFGVLEIPKKVGGRFSVFSPVGLFPLGMLDIDIEMLMKGAKEIRDFCLSADITDNPAAVSAGSIYLHYLNKISIHDVFLFSTDLESVGKWYRQLMGESIGKEYNLENKQVFTGITPTVSIGSVDLHSMAQMYLGGPYDKFTTFITVENNFSNISIPNKQEYEDLVKGIQGRSLKDVMDAILVGTQKAFEKKKRPFMEIKLPDKSAYYIGQLLQFKMLEMMYLGSLMGVNTFNQPNVEEYKIETKAILEGKIGVVN